MPFITAGWRGMHRHVQALYAAAGAPSDHMPLAVQQYVYVTDDKAEALEVAERARRRPRGDGYAGGRSCAQRVFISEMPLADEPPIETFRDNLVIGDAHLVAERLVNEVRELGTTHLSCFMQIGSIDGRRAQNSLSRCAAEVVPLMEKAFGMALADMNGGQTQTDRGVAAPALDSANAIDAA